MEAVARLRFVRMSPQKGRLVADMIRGRKVSEAEGILRFTPKKSARIIEKLLKSAKANAEEKNVADPDEMVIEKIIVDKGPVMKRQLPRARGRVDVLQKPFSHVTIVLSGGDILEKKKKGKAPEKKAGEIAAKPTAKKKTAVKKGTAKKADTAKKTATKKTAAKKAATAQKAAAAKKKTAAKKGTAKKAGTAKKTVSKKTAAKKTASKKTAATAKKSAKKSK
jgi:large subunit ribosomal protein L22